VRNVKKTAYCILYAGFFLDSLFYPEDGGDILLRNVYLSSNYTTLQPLHPQPVSTSNGWLWAGSTNR
jgi:hypothetical protein